MRHRLSSALSLIRVMGLPNFAKFAFYHALTAPRLWERFLVRSIGGRSLARVVKELPSFKSEALVTVVLPVNNGRSKGVELLVGSLKGQTHGNIEFVAVDSGSTDDTVPWLRGQGFNVVEIAPRDFSHSYSRNTGAAAASGTFLLFVVDDAVFTDPNWLRSALFLLEKFDADAMSSRQTIDANADAYARLLDYYLANAQSGSLSVNVSRRSRIARVLRSLLPLRTTIRSVSIDDTNHLVRKASFDRLQFQTPTVEDIDFAKRLTASGGTTLYTNLLSVRHYHSYAEGRLRNYAKRVFVDTKVISKWQPYHMRFHSREAMLLAAYHTLAVLLQALDEFGRRTDVPTQVDPYYAEQRRRAKLPPRDGVTDLLDITRKVEASPSSTIAGAHTVWSDAATAIFAEVLGAAPPSNLFFDAGTYKYYMRRTRGDISGARPILAELGRGPDDLTARRTVCLFLWCNRLMAHLARNEIFESVTVPYDVDSWGIADWA